MAIDKNEAPEGYEAVENVDGVCDGCAFDPAGNICPTDGSGYQLCAIDARNDATEVYFIKKEESAEMKDKIEMGKKYRTDDGRDVRIDRKRTRLDSSHTVNSYAVFCL